MSTLEPQDNLPTELPKLENTKSPSAEAWFEAARTAYQMLYSKALTQLAEALAAKKVALQQVANCHIHENQMGVVMIKNGDQVWVTGEEFEIPGTWGFIGVFATEAEAVAACGDDDNCFVGPQKFGTVVPKGPQAWVGAYYPTRRS